MSEWPATFELREVRWTDPGPTELRAQMDAEIVPRYADLTFAAADALIVNPADVYFTLVVFDGETPAATASLKNTDGLAEIKRVFVAPRYRRLGLAGRLLADTEVRAAARGRPDLVLQTGFRQPEAISLYERHGWTAIPNFGPYVVDTVISRCFAKHIVEAVPSRDHP
jgi:GNAT superfamily N-acetyltransferase